MQPQHKKKKAEKLPLDGGREPMTEKGQRYAAPAGRHSQQTHARAEARAAAAGQTEKEQHAADRAETIAEMTEATESMARNKAQSSQR